MLGSIPDSRCFRLQLRYSESRLDRNVREISYSTERTLRHKTRVVSLQCEFILRRRQR